MSRDVPAYSVVIVSVALLVVGTGYYLAGTPLVAPSYPDKPADLTTQTVEQYATEYERAETYRALSELGTRVSLTCNATVDRRTENGFYVIAACAATTRTLSGVGSGGPVPHPYFINTTTTIRIDAEHRPSLTQETIYKPANETEHVRPRGLKVVNFDSTGHRVGVTITYENTTVPETAFATSYRIAGHSGVEQDAVTIREGVYTVNATLADGTSDTARWRVLESNWWAGDITIYITPDGDLAISNSPRPAAT